MSKRFLHVKAVTAAVAITLGLPGMALAEDKYEALQRKLEALQQELREVKQALEQTREEKASRAEVSQLEKKVDSASEWKDPNTLIHMAGYADVGFTNGDNENGSFRVGGFSPIFHFQYKDLVMLESEVEFEIEEDGSTNIGLEYLTIDWFANDYVTVIGGRFLSPIGQFRQNLHPSWINKLASAPLGYGHDGAAPTSETGIQLRGGFPLGRMRANYAVYVGNGPELIAGWDGSEFELDGIEAEGFGADSDGDKVWGGRFALLPMQGLEVGVSAATGKATVTSVEDDLGTAPSLGTEQARDYDVLGVDAVWFRRNMTLRGEYVRSKVGAATTGVSASDGAEWTAWYVQGSYLFPRTKYEAVLRYSDFDSPEDAKDQTQWALGLNYLFTSNFIAKLSYEANDGQSGTPANDDRWYFQFAYGF